jgi:S1-C subfamily serine protease
MRKVVAWSKRFGGLAGLALAWAAAAPALAAAAEESFAGTLKTVVGVHTVVPADARTAETLGTERLGSGIVIDDKGLVLTIGYLMLEAERAEIVGPDGRRLMASVVGYDHNTGFGLLRMAEPLDVKPARFGDSSALAEGAKVLAVSFAGPRPIVPAFVVSRRDFAGYWEYLLENAIFTSPPHLFHSGAGLFAEDGSLVGVGHLFVNNAAGPDTAMPGNMFVPIDALKPILADLMERGRSAARPHPWLGVYMGELKGRLFVARVTPGGPAERSGLKAGDIIVGVGGKRVRDMADFLRKAWAQGDAGVEVPLDILRLGADDMNVRKFVVPSGDRYEWLKIKRGL